MAPLYQSLDDIQTQIFDFAHFNCLDYARKFEMIISYFPIDFPIDFPILLYIFGWLPICRGLFWLCHFHSKCPADHRKFWVPTLQKGMTQPSQDHLHLVSYGWMCCWCGTNMWSPKKVICSSGQCSNMAMKTPPIYRWFSQLETSIYSWYSCFSRIFLRFSKDFSSENPPIYQGFLDETTTASWSRRWDHLQLPCGWTLKPGEPSGNDHSYWKWLITNSCGHLCWFMLIYVDLNHSYIVDLCWFTNLKWWF